MPGCVISKRLVLSSLKLKETDRYEEGRVATYSITLFGLALTGLMIQFY